MSRLLLLMILCVSLCESANILAIFPTPSLSHQVVFRPLIRELLQRGHQVTVITADPVSRNEDVPANLTEIDVHDVSYKVWEEGFVYKLEFGEKYTVYQQIDAAIELMEKVTVEHLKDERIRNLIEENGDFDLLLVEAWTRQAYIYSNIFKLPVVAVSSFGLMMGNGEMMGAPIHPLYFQNPLQQRLYNLTFWEKLHELYKSWWFRSTWYSKCDKEINSFREVLGPDLPGYDELLNNIDFLLLNTHETLIDNQPLPTNVKLMWGIHQKPEKELPPELKSYLDSSKNGVIYVSFGNNAPSITLPSEFIQLLKRVFSKLPYDVLWKWENDEMQGKPENVKISKWFPQSDLLRHPKVKLFITQGGLQSFQETVKAGVPIVGIPLLGDQWHNVEKYEKHGIGIRLDMDTITEDKLGTAIEVVIHNESYKVNILRLRTLMSDQPEGALQRAVWWSEYVLRHGGAKHLRAAAGANLSFMHYYEVELLIEISILFLCITAAFLTITFVLFKYLEKFVVLGKLKTS